MKVCLNDFNVCYDKIGGEPTTIMNISFKPGDLIKIRHISYTDYPTKFPAGGSPGLVLSQYPKNQSYGRLYKVLVGEETYEVWEDEMDSLTPQ